LKNSIARSKQTEAHSGERWVDGCNCSRKCIFLLPSTANRLSETVGSFVETKNHVHEIYFNFIFFRLHRLSAPFPNVYIKM